MSATRARGRPAALESTAPSDAQVLDAALDAFAERGFADTSVREVARQLGVSHNLIPQRFGSKEQLWFAAVDHGFAELLVDLLPLALDELPDDLTRLRAWMVRFIEINAARPALLRIISREAASSGARLDYLFERYIEPVRAAGAGLLASLAEQRAVTTTSVELVYFLMTHGAGGPVAYPALAARFGDQVSRDDPEAIRAHAEAAVDLLFEGLQARPAPP
jgi:AcrR family transcriptional regulator